jgi:hypothetical protein
MPHGVFVPGTVTATDMAADQADTQMHPGVTVHQARFTSRRAGRHIPNLIHVGALMALENAAQ